MIKSSNWPIGSTITLTDCNGASKIKGKVVEHPGPYSLVIQTPEGRYFASTALVVENENETT